MVTNSSHTSLSALAMESGTVAKYLSNKSFLPKQDYKDYKDEMRHLQGRLAHLTEGKSSLNSKEIKLQTECLTHIRTIEVRLGFFDPDRKFEVKSQFYTAQIEHLELRLSELEASLKETISVRKKHGTLHTPCGKERLLKNEMENLKSRIQDIRLKQSALY